MNSYKSFTEFVRLRENFNQKQEKISQSINYLNQILQSLAKLKRGIQAELEEFDFENNGYDLSGNFTDEQIEKGEKTDQLHNFIERIEETYYKLKDLISQIHHAIYNKWMKNDFDKIKNTINEYKKMRNKMTLANNKWSMSNLGISLEKEADQVVDSIEKLLVSL